VVVQFPEIQFLSTCGQGPALMFFFISDNIFDLLSDIFSHFW